MLKIHVFFKQLFCLLALAAMLTAANPAAAENKMLDGDYTYDILRNGTQIGTYSFHVTNRDDMSTTVQATMNIEAKVLFLTAYKADHQRVEEYLKGALQKIHGEAKFNGKDYAFTYDAKLDQVDRNGEIEQLKYPVVTLSPFKPRNTEGKFIGLSEKGKTHEAYFEDNGIVKKKSGIKLHPFHELAFIGDVRRDLWYTPEGILDSLSYDKDGATITFKRRAKN